MKQVRFRQSGAVWVVALIAAFGSFPVAATRWYLYWLPLVPLLVVVWGLRSGTDAGPDGLRVRALFGDHRVPWARVVALGSPDGRRVLARLDNDTLLPLTAVPPAGIPALVEASGQAVLADGTDPDDATTDDATTDDATARDAAADRPQADGPAGPEADAPAERPDGTGQ